MMPCFASSAFIVVPTDTESKIASTATPREHLLLVERNAELLVRLAAARDRRRRGLPSGFFVFGAE